MAVQGPYHALGTVWFVECFEPVDDGVVRELVVRELEVFEQMFSRFRQNSMLNQLNQTCRLTAHALRYHETTNGVFNIAVGERLSSLGYDAHYSFTKQQAVPEVPVLSDVLTVSDDKVVLTGGSLDIGGFGKGVAIDLVASRLADKLGLTQVLVNGGGDIFVTERVPEPVTISLVHPTEAGSAIGEVTLKGQGFAASSPFLRTWPDHDGHGGKTHNHLMTENEVATYVVAPSAAHADVWATALAINPDLEPPADVQAVLVKDNKVLQCGEGFELFEREA